MRLLSVVSLLAIGALTNASNLRRRNYETNDYYVLHLEASLPPSEVATQLGLTHEGQLGELEDHHVFSSHKQEQDIVRIALKERRKGRRSLGDAHVLDGVKFAQKQKLKRLHKRGAIPPPPEGYVAPKARQQIDEDQPVPAALNRQKSVMKTLEISDPTFHEQWHLFNPVQLGHDVNVTDVWLSGITGQNTTVAMVDDGLDMYSNDLKDNYFAEGSWDYNDPGPEPKPRLSDDRHGTRCAGEISAVKNDVCGVGVAYNSKIAGIRILSKLISDSDEAEALNYKFQKNLIYSCSWGPPDDGKSMDAPGILIKRAMLNAVQKGRGGKGSIYVFASGNGAGSEDNCNFDGYTNSIYSITIGALDRKGQHPYYSELCSAQLVVTYSSGSGDSIHTTDVGENKCTSAHGGTSAAAPLAAGIFALILQVRPDLTWRDMQSVVLQSAVPVDLDTGDWQKTTLGRHYSHTFGYGKIDSWAAIELAKTFKSLKPQAWFYSPWIHVKQKIPEGEKGLAVTFEVTDEMLKSANLQSVEHVTVTMNVEHTRRGDLSVELISPDKIVSHLSAPRRLDHSQKGYNDWTFMSVVHWGESGVGKWTVIVKDTVINEFNGTFVDWHLKLYGESIDASKATLLPLPTDHDDDDHNKEDLVSTTTIMGATSSGNPVPTKSFLSEKPSDHPERPTKPLSSPSPTTTAQDDTITFTMPPIEEETSVVPTATPSATSVPSSWLPSFFPTFGVSSKTQVWIYGAAALILIFCGALGVYLFLARRKRLRNNPREEWEFDLIQDDEAEGLTGGGAAAAGVRAKGGKRRAGELYDAFAAGSDEESESVGSYQDTPLEGDEQEKRLYESDEDEEQHVIGDDDSSDDEERRPRR